MRRLCVGGYAQCINLQDVESAIFMLYIEKWLDLLCDGEQRVSIRISNIRTLYLSIDFL